MSNLPALRRPSGSLALPDNAQWTNRFQVKSETTNRLYTIAQNIKERHWACGCSGWIRWSHCKHLTALGLPGYKRPYEVLLK